MALTQHCSPVGRAGDLKASFCPPIYPTHSQSGSSCPCCPPAAWRSVLTAPASSGLLLATPATGNAPPDLKKREVWGWGKWPPRTVCPPPRQGTGASYPAPADTVVHNLHARGTHICPSCIFTHTHTHTQTPPSALKCTLTHAHTHSELCGLTPSNNQ